MFALCLPKIFRLQFQGKFCRISAVFNRQGVACSAAVTGSVNTGEISETGLRSFIFL